MTSEPSALAPPIFIIGSPRSGTTLLRLMLTCHRNIVIPPECGFAVWWWEKYRDADMSDAAVLRGFATDVLSSKKMETWQLDVSRLVEFLHDRSPSSYAAAVSAVYELYGRSSQRTFTRWGDKNNFYVAHIPDLDALFPSCCFLQMVRDGRDVACSYRELQGRVIESKYAPAFPAAIEDIAAQWQRNVVSADRDLARLPGSRVQTVHFEDLLRQPRATLAAICAHLGEGLDPHMLEYAAANREQELEPREFLQWKEKTLTSPDLRAIGRYRADLTPAEVETFERVAAEALRRHGYR